VDAAREVGVVSHLFCGTDGLRLALAGLGYGATALEPEIESRLEA